MGAPFGFLRNSTFAQCTSTSRPMGSHRSLNLEQDASCLRTRRFRAVAKEAARSIRPLVCDASDWRGCFFGAVADVFKSLLGRGDGCRRTKAPTRKGCKLQLYRNAWKSEE